MIRVSAKSLQILVICCMMFAARHSRAADRPNLLFVYADQLRYKSLGYAGDKKALMPHLDKLAAAGVNFKNYVVSTPVCAAFRASLMTGKYAS